VLQSTCAPTNDNLDGKVLVMVDALKRRFCRAHTAAMPYFGYARQDRGCAPHSVAITANWWPICFPSPVWIAC